MSWVRIDDGMVHHPKVIRSGKDGFVLDIAGLSYASRYETDGFIPDEALAILTPLVSSPSEAATQLVAVGRWRRDDKRLGYVIHDFDDYQPTADDKSQARERRSAAGQKAARARWDAVRNAQQKRDASQPQSATECNTQRTVHAPVPSPSNEPKGEANVQQSRPQSAVDELRSAAKKHPSVPGKRFVKGSGWIDTHERHEPEPLERERVSEKLGVAREALLRGRQRALEAMDAASNDTPSALPPSLRSVADDERSEGAP